MKTVELKKITIVMDLNLNAKVSNGTTLYTDWMIETNAVKTNSI